jgi:hypothetical protein
VLALRIEDSSSALCQRKHRKVFRENFDMSAVNKLRNTRTQLNYSINVLRRDAILEEEFLRLDKTGFFVTWSGTCCAPLGVRESRKKLLKVLALPLRTCLLAWGFLTGLPIFNFRSHGGNSNSDSLSEPSF